MSRKRARVSILLFAFCLLCLLLTVITQKVLLVVVSVLVAGAAIAVRPWKCPACGKHIGSRPQWTMPGKYHCTYCGNRMVYDDESAE